MMLLAHSIKKFKGAVHKNGDIDGTCKRSLILQYFLVSFTPGGKDQSSVDEGETTQMFSVQCIIKLQRLAPYSFTCILY